MCQCPFIRSNSFGRKNRESRSPFRFVRRISCCKFDPLFARLYQVIYVHIYMRLSFCRPISRCCQSSNRMFETEKQPERVIQDCDIGSTLSLRFVCKESTLCSGMLFEITSAFFLGLGHPYIRSFVVYWRSISRCLLWNLVDTLRLTRWAARTCDSRVILVRFVSMVSSACLFSFVSDGCVERVSQGRKSTWEVLTWSSKSCVCRCGHHDFGGLYRLEREYMSYYSKADLRRLSVFGYDGSLVSGVVVVSHISGLFGETVSVNRFINNRLVV